MDFLRRTPFFRMLVPLIGGIVVFHFQELFILAEVIILISAVILIFTSFLFTKSQYAYLYRWLFGSGISLLLFIIGYFVAEQNAQKSVFTSPETSGIFKTEIVDTPVEKINSVLCRVKVIGFYDGMDMVKTSSASLMYFAKDSDALHLEKGDVLILRTTFQSPSRVMNPEGFDYASFLKRKGISVTAYMPADSWQKISHHNGFSLLSLAGKYRNQLLEVYERIGLEPKEFAVLAALTLGYKDVIDPELREDFSYAGAMHILAVSGLHVGVIYLILNFLLSLVFKSTKWRFLHTFLIVGLLWFYAFITGLPPSVIRSATMFSFVAIGNALGRKSQIYNTISVSAFIILLQNPNYLFDVGFQLSYSAVISIVYFQPKISKWIYIKSRLLKWLWDLTAVSLAAQLGTLPLVLYYFHQFPNYFLLTNFVVIPLATLIIYVAVVFLMSSWLPLLALIPSVILKHLLLLLNNLVAFVHDLPHSISDYYIDSWQLLLLFAGLILMAFFIENKRYWSLSGCLLVVLLLLVTDVYREYQTYRTDSFIVFSDRKHTHINFVSGMHHQMMTTDSVAGRLTAGNYWKSRNLHAPEINSSNSSFFKQFRDERYLILQDDFLKRKKSQRPIVVDKLIIGNFLKPRSDELFDCVAPKICIADQTISAWYVDKLRKSCDKRDIVFYSVAEQGAYVCNFKQ